MRADVDVVACGADTDAASLRETIARGEAPYVLLHRQGLAVGESVVDALVAAMRAPMAATASPVPVAAADAGRVSVVPPHPRLPPPATLATPCDDIVLVAREAAASVPPHGVAHPDAAGGRDPDWRTYLAALSRRLVASGWRHVTAPGVAFAWVPADDPVNGAANEALATHRLWAGSHARGVRLVLDGACLTDAPHNGSQAVVWNIAMALKRTRPEAHVSLAVPERHLAHLRGLADGSGVAVVVRGGSAVGFDVAYRPYQPLDPGDLDWLVGAGQRLLTSQLDMIAFSNPEYHPSPVLFHAVRNLQRATMRFADGVTFISEFGRQSALAECPDIERDRTFVVTCGADPTPAPDRRPSAAVAARVAGRFLVCTSATFMHKNRQHAIRVFDELCRVHGYGGALVIVGPEPFYGRSGLEDRALIDSLDPAIAGRVFELGQVDEQTKWWLLEAADLVLYPSVVEGFGLVPFEAAAVGTPCLSYAGSGLGEVLGGSPATLPTWDVATWAAAAAEMVSGSANTVVTETRRVATRFTWDGTAERTWEAIDTVIASPRARLHAEEGGIASRVAGADTVLAPGARLAHFANRVRSYAERRWGR